MDERSRGRQNMGLEKLLYLRGVGAEFTDCFGQNIHISEVDRQGILTCMLQEKNSVAGTAIDAPATEAPAADTSENTEATE